MAKITPHELLSQEDVEYNINEMFSYAEMRKVLIEVLRSTKGNKKLYLRQILDVMDLTCELSLQSFSHAEVEAEIYSILS